VIENEDGSVAVRLQLESSDAVGLAGVGPVELEHLAVLEGANRPVGLLRAVALLPAEQEAAAEAKLELGDVRQPAAEPFRLGQRRPELVGSRVVAALEAHAGPVALSSELSLGHVVPS
jgi:hypothetical protein